MTELCSLHTEMLNKMELGKTIPFPELKKDKQSYNVLENLCEWGYVEKETTPLFKSNIQVGFHASFKRVK